MINSSPKNWQIIKISECCEILDNKRVPLSAEKRKSMKGTIPYYGANGLLDYINDFIFNEDLILIAEDGGYFDEFATRPIAYQISGKSWVNNHAHILRAKEGYNWQYIYYCLVHKDIRKFLNGGARSKLNKSELMEITLFFPPILQQNKISDILSTWDKAIDIIEKTIILKKNRRDALISLLIKNIGSKQKLCKFLIFTPREVRKPTSSYMALGIRSHCKGTFQRLIENPNSIKMEKLYKVEENNLIVNITFAWEGAIALVKKEDKECLVSHRFPTYKFNTSIALPEYVKYIISQKDFIFKLKLISSGGAGRNRVLNKKDFLNLEIKLPDLHEQKRIAEILDTASLEIEKETIKVQLLKMQKKGLMQKLLSGEWPVIVDQESKEWAA